MAIAKLTSGQEGEARQEPREPAAREAAEVSCAPFVGRYQDERSRKAAWFLNFDADEELARPLGYAPSRAVLSRFGALRELARGLFGPEDIVIDADQSPEVGPEYIGIAWCPTPRARRALRQAGASIPSAPPLDILRAVNHRRFCADLGQTLPGAHYAFAMDEVEEALAAPSPTGEWLLKRPFGFAGRGRVRVNPASSAERAHTKPWIEASLRSSEGLQVEPLVERVGDFALHGYIRRTGEILLGEPTRQICDATGAWLSTERAQLADLSTTELNSLVAEASLAGAALYRAGYFGPFGIDAFRYAFGDGERFNPRCEINARYSMGWAIGMGAARPDLDELESLPV